MLTRSQTAQAADLAARLQAARQAASPWRLGRLTAIRQSRGGTQEEGEREEGELVPAAAAQSPGWPEGPTDAQVGAPLAGGMTIDQLAEMMRGMGEQLTKLTATVTAQFKSAEDRAAADRADRAALQAQVAGLEDKVVSLEAKVAALERTAASNTADVKVALNGTKELEQLASRVAKLERAAAASPADRPRQQSGQRAGAGRPQPLERPHAGAPHAGAPHAAAAPTPAPLPGPPPRESGWCSFKADFPIEVPLAWGQMLDGWMQEQLFHLTQGVHLMVTGSRVARRPRNYAGRTTRVLFSVEAGASREALRGIIRHHAHEVFRCTGVRLAEELPPEEYQQLRRVRGNSGRGMADRGGTGHRTPARSPRQTAGVAPAQAGPLPPPPAVDARQDPLPQQAAAGVDAMSQQGATSG